MRNRIALLGIVFAVVALTAGCDTLPNIDVAGWFGDSAPAAPQAQPAPQPPAQAPPAMTADAPPQAAPTEKIQTDPLPAQADNAQTDMAQTDMAQAETAQNLPIDGMQREDLRGAFGVDDKVEPMPGSGL